MQTAGETQPLLLEILPAITERGGSWRKMLCIIQGASGHRRIIEVVMVLRCQGRRMS